MHLTLQSSRCHADSSSSISILRIGTATTSVSRCLGARKLASAAPISPTIRGLRGARSGLTSIAQPSGNTSCGSYMAFDHEKTSAWCVNYVVAPLTPFFLSWLFRSLSPTAPASALLWGTEIPFFTIVLSVATTIRCIEHLSKVKASGHTGGSVIWLSWARIGLGAIAFSATSLLMTYYVDLYLVSLPDAVKYRVGILQLVLATASLIAGAGILVFEQNATSSKNHSQGIPEAKAVGGTP